MDHILLVEDEVPLRNALQRCFAAEPNFDLHAAGTLREALTSIDLRPPALIVLDVDLPDGSGFELLPELARRGQNPKILLITAHAQRFRNELAETAHLEVLQKPFDISRFKQLVLEALPRGERAAAAFTVSDYLQLAGMARRSVVLKVTQAGRALGQVVVQDGAPCFAEDEHGLGEAAFRRLALLPRADVVCEPLSGPYGRSNLQGSLEALLLDAARYADEHARSPTSPPKAIDTKRGPESSRRNPAPPSTPGPSSSPLPALPVAPAVPRVRAAAPPKPGAARAIGLAAFPGSKSGARPATKENIVPLKTSKPALAQLLTLDSTLKAAARSDQQGSVLEQCGELDAETTCAVVNLAARQILDATSELGLGRPLSWHVAVGESTWYVVQAQSELFVTFGGSHKNPVSTLKKLAKSCGES